MAKSGAAVQAYSFETTVRFVQGLPLLKKPDSALLSRTLGPAPYHRKRREPSFRNWKLLSRVTLCRVRPIAAARDRAGPTLRPRP